MTLLEWLECITGWLNLTLHQKQQDDISRDPKDGEEKWQGLIPRLTAISQINSQGVSAKTALEIEEHLKFLGSMVSKVIPAIG